MECDPYESAVLKRALAPNTNDGRQDCCSLVQNIAQHYIVETIGVAAGHAKAQSMYVWFEKLCGENV